MIRGIGKQRSFSLFFIKEKIGVVEWFRKFLILLGMSLVIV